MGIDVNKPLSINSFLSEDEMTEEQKADNAGVKESLDWLPCGESETPLSLATQAATGLGIGRALNYGGKALGRLLGREVKAFAPENGAAHVREISKPRNEPLNRPKPQHYGLSDIPLGLRLNPANNNYAPVRNGVRG